MKRSLVMGSILCERDTEHAYTKGREKTKVEERRIEKEDEWWNKFHSGVGAWHEDKGWRGGLCKGDVLFSNPGQRDFRDTVMCSLFAEN